MSEIAGLDHSMQEQALGNSRATGFAGERPGDEVLLVRFFNHPKQNFQKTAAEGRPIFEDVDYIEIAAPGDKDSVIIRPAFTADKARFPRHFEAYKVRHEDHLEGTPLSAWPLVTRAQVEELAFFHVRTVEALANMSDGDAQKFMGIQKLQKLARAYLAEAKDKAPIAAMQKELEERDSKISGLETQLQAMDKKMQEILDKD